MTSNPAIFEKAIAGSTDYEQMLTSLLISEGLNVNITLLFSQVGIHAGHSRLASEEEGP